jgi:hypothetical protein
MSTKTRNIDYGVRSFDLGTARDNERVPLRGRHLSVLAADAEATIRLGDGQASGIPARKIQSISLPKDVENIYLSNPANSGELILLNGLEGTEASVPSPDSTFDLTDDSAREIGKVRVQDSGGVLVDPASEGTLSTLEGKAATETTLSSVDSRVLDRSDATAITAEDSGVGSANAATATLGPLRSSVNVHVDTSGAATLTVEVSPDGGTSWLQFDTVDYSSATTEVEAYPEVAFADVRAYLDTNRNGVTLASKGV